MMRDDLKFRTDVFVLNMVVFIQRCCVFALQGEETRGETDNLAQNTSGFNFRCAFLALISGSLALEGDILISTTFIFALNRE